MSKEIFICKIKKLKFKATPFNINYVNSYFQGIWFSPSPWSNRM